MSDLRWMDRAACRDHEPETWWPIGTTGPAVRQIADARRICYACPVLIECRAWALDSLEFGIAGGLTEDERRSLKRRERRERRGTGAGARNVGRSGAPLVDTAAARAAILAAHEHSTWLEIADRCGVSRHTIEALGRNERPHKRIEQPTEDAILSALEPAEVQP